MIFGAQRTEGGTGTLNCGSKHTGGKIMFIIAR